MDEITDGLIDAHLEHGPKVPALQSTTHIYPINGAVHDVESDATAFGNRDANFSTVIAGMCWSAALVISPAEHASSPLVLRLHHSYSVAA